MHSRVYSVYLTATRRHTLTHKHTHIHSRETVGGKNNHLKALIRIWTVTRLVHKLGEIWVGITIWQPAVRHQTSGVISIFSHDSERCDKQHHAASQSVRPPSEKCGKLGPGWVLPPGKNNKRSEVEVRVEGETFRDAPIPDPAPIAHSNTCSGTSKIRTDPATWYFETALHGWCI